jgi:hypothetical protein
MTEPEPADEFDDVVRPLRDVPPSFLSPAERRRRRPVVTQPAMFDEPDHTPERSRRASYRRTRDAGKPRTFKDAVKRRREEREGGAA